MNSQFTEVFAEPDNLTSIIDTVNPATGRSAVNDDTLEQIRRRYPTAERIPWEDWRARKIAEQDTPIRWDPSTAEQYADMLNILPPRAWTGGGFLVGEPTDHSAATGAPRYQAYRYAGHRYAASSRPVTVAEFRVALTQAWS